MKKKEIFFYVILLALYVLNSLTWEFLDEWDNILGGKLITQGILPYTGFFSHHLPLPYFISSLIHLLSGTNFIFFRVIFALLLFTWAISLYRYVRTQENEGLLKYYLITLALFSSLTWMHMFLAETFAGYATMTVFLVICYRSDSFSWKDAIVLSSCAFLVVASSLGFSFLSATIYFIAAYYAFRNRRMISGRQWGIMLAAAMAPYVLFSLYVALTGSLQEIYWHNFVFNRQFYFKYFIGFPEKNILIPVFVLRNFIGSYWYVLSSLSLKNIVYPVLLLFNAAYFAFLLKNKKYDLFFFAFLLLAFSSTRMNMMFDFSVHFHGNIPIYALSLFFFASVTHGFFRSFMQDTREFRRDVFSFSGTVAAALFFAFVLTEAAGSYFAVFSGGRIRNERHEATVLNSLLRDDETYWIGPAELRKVYFTNRRLATGYYAYLPWFADSERIRTRFLGDLRSKMPEIVVFNKEEKIWGFSPKEYARDLIAHLDGHYARLTVREGGSTYPNFYLLKAKMPELLDRKRDAIMASHSLHLAPKRHLEKGVTEGSAIQQTFLSPHSRLRGVLLLVSTYKSKIRTPYKLVLRDAACDAVIRETVLDNERIRDNEYVPVLFDPVDDSAGKTFCFSLFPAAGPVETPITVHFSDPDAYPEGLTTVNGKPMNEDVVFELIY